MKPKTTSCYMPYSTPINLFIIENTYIFHFNVFGPLMKWFNTDVQVQLDSRVWPSRWKWGTYHQDVYNPITLWDKYHDRQGYFVVECMNVFLHSWNKLSHKIYDVLLYRTPSYLCVCTKLHVCTSKNSFLLVTQFIYDKTVLSRVISLYGTAEVYFGYVINYCDANRLKFGAPGWMM
jgi:hypothetical protein